MDLAYRASVHQQVQRAEDSWSAAEDAGAQAVWKQARAYNRLLAGGTAGAGVSEVEPYASQLAYGEGSSISYVSVESVGIGLPVYRGADERALASGAGHVEGTSLPVGGKTSNCCIAAHSGIATASMFNRLRDVRIGAFAELRTLGRSLWYRVASVEIVEPQDTSLLELQEGRDLLTLVTCTGEPTAFMPRGGYGVNDRRLVVVCERCAAPGAGGAENGEPALLARIAPTLVAAFLVVLVAGALARRKRTGFWKRRRKET